jgi:large subunit ribosomal protein L10
MIKQYKIDEVDSLVSKLEEKSNFILTNYSGIKVRDLSQLRNSLREKNAEYKVIKNNLFKRALEKVGVEGLGQYLKGPVGVAFIKEEVGEITKILKEFGEKQEKFTYSVGC